MSDFGYREFLGRYHLTESDVQRIMADLPQSVPNKASDSVFTLGLSQINGLGMFCKRDVKALDVFPVCDGDVRFNLARYVNHSNSPNATFWLDREKRGWMTVLFDLERGTEILFDYNANMETLAALNSILFNRDVVELD